MNFFKIKKNDINEQKSDWAIKDNYIEVNDNFKMSDLKPYQRFIILKDDNVSKRYLVDFALTRSEIDRLNSITLDSRSEELKTDKPFRMISACDIDLGQGKISDKNIAASYDEFSILNNLTNVNPFIEPKTKKTNVSNANDFNILKAVEEKSKKSKKNKDTIFPIENETELKIDIEPKEENEISTVTNGDDEDFNLNDFIAPDDDNPINQKLRDKYKNKLIFDDNAPIEMCDNDLKTVILPFKLREVNEEWKKNDQAFFRTDAKRTHGWFTDNIEDDFLKDLEDTYNGSLSSPFLETYEPVSDLDTSSNNVMDQNLISSDDNVLFLIGKNNLYETDIINDVVNQVNIDDTNNEDNINNINQVNIDDANNEDNIDEVNHENTDDTNNEDNIDEVNHENTDDTNNEDNIDKVNHENTDDANNEDNIDEVNHENTDDINQDNVDDNSIVDDLDETEKEQVLDYVIDNEISSFESHDEKNDNVLNNQIEVSFDDNTLVIEKKDNNVASLFEPVDKKEINIFNDEIEVSFDNNMLTVEKNDFQKNKASSELKKEYDDTLFFKKDVVAKKVVHLDNRSHDNNVKKMFIDPHKNNVNSKYEKIKLSKLNNMVIFRKKIDKRLIKERSKKSSFSQI